MRPRGETSDLQTALITLDPFLRTLRCDIRPGVMTGCTAHVRHSAVSLEPSVH